jgi:hypothetical protein
LPTHSIDCGGVRDAAVAAGLAGGVCAQATSHNATHATTSRRKAGTNRSIEISSVSLGWSLDY